MIKIYSLLFILFTALAGQAQSIITTHSADDRYPRWSPDGDKIVFESNREGNWNVYVINRDGTGLQQITSDKANHRRPSWHPDGTKLLFESDRDGKSELYLYNLSDRSIKKILAVQHDIISAQFSPDGNKIAFSSGSIDPVNFNIFIYEIKRDTVRQLTFDTTRSLFPGWSYDGNSLVYFSRQDTNNETDELYTLNIANGEITRITRWPTHNFAPSWSPDGLQIVCSTSMEESRPELFTVMVESGAMIRLTFNDYGDTEPHWSPTGEEIVYACQQNGNYDICIINLNQD